MKERLTAIRKRESDQTTNGRLENQRLGTETKEQRKTKGEKRM